MKFNTAGVVYNLSTEQELPTTIEWAWNFLSDPKNLGTITPDSMGFEIISGDDKSMYPGQIIQYKIKLFPGVKLTWVTEISHVKHQEYFVDEQRFGPYAFWHHKHFIKETKEGIVMYDSIDYKVPGWIFRKWIHAVLVQPKLKSIFEYRKIALEAMFKK